MIGAMDAHPDLLPPDDPACLELDPDTMAALGRRTLERALAHIAEVEHMPARGDMDTAAVCRAVSRAAPPEHGEPLDDLLATVVDDCVPRSFTTISPGSRPSVTSMSLPMRRPTSTGLGDTVILLSSTIHTLGSSL